MPAAGQAALENLENTFVSDASDKKGAGAGRGRCGAGGAPEPCRVAGGSLPSPPPPSHQRVASYLVMPGEGGPGKNSLPSSQV